MARTGAISLVVLAASALTIEPAFAADALDGAKLSWFWALPFAGILLTIATGPLLFPALWHHRYPLFALGWTIVTLLPVALVYGATTAAATFVHAALAEYLSFIVLLFALYVVAGGILITGDLRGTPLVNTGILAFGTVIASLVGTTGAAMILIRPLLRANAHRDHNAHVVVFFIFLVCNIGGALTPLGDPPLFIGFLRGVDFFWTTKNLWMETLLASVIVLAVFFVIDATVARRERSGDAKPANPERIGVSGTINLLLIALIIAAILASAIWQPNLGVDILGTHVALQNLARDIALLAIAGASMILTPREHRAANGFSWEPIREVTILFAAIFVCIAPVLAMLSAGRNGAFAGLIDMITRPGGGPNNAAYFWLTGMLSGFLDNAPTYLVFFGLAGGDAKALMTSLAPTLSAISLGAVYMGALSYIGNAPNFMVYAVANEAGVKMPSFFGYMFWSCCVLLPVFALLSFVWF